MTKTHQETHLKDYCPYPYNIKSIDLHFSLGEESTKVTSSFVVEKLIASAPDGMMLDGENLELITVAINGTPLQQKDYTLKSNSLTIHNPPASFILSIETAIKPHKNFSLEGLYKSNGMFCTQCEAEGFRKITFFPDRPDVLTVYTVTIEADKDAYPILLANGNHLKSKDISPNRHQATWKDPFPKPCYLFALVAGNLAVLEDSFTTKTGREIKLQIFTEQHNADKCDHAMRSLKKAMAWDESRFSLEVDLDQYMIVAVDDFNAGAMENKGLNIFNSKYVLANPQTATDQDYEGIESVVAHEYFHNWTGNRVTCRDWFQLSLKEGLTVFRDQEFTSDTNSRAIKRIQDATFLRNHQFAEDAGPMAHPIRPESYIEINNFYTLTVYEKGAEVIRMLHTIIGEKLFQEGMKLYFERHDGKAVTTEDFVDAMEDALKNNGSSGKPVDLTLFRRWYSQAGTPTLTVSSDYNEAEKTFKLTVQQLPAKVTGQKPAMLHIPLSVGLVTENGDLAVTLDSSPDTSPKKTHTLNITTATQSFLFQGVHTKPLPSLLRQFSAPVKLDYTYSDDELIFLVLNDTDSFCKFEAGQRLFTKHLIRCTKDFSEHKTPAFDNCLTEIFKTFLTPGFETDTAFLAQILSLPTEDFIADQLDVVDVDAVHKAREFIRKNISDTLFDLLLATYIKNSSTEPYSYSPIHAGQRQLKNLCLALLLATPSQTAENLCMKQFSNADNMTDEIAALKILVHAGCRSANSALDTFFKKWSNDALVMDKWFSIQATAPILETLDQVNSLLNHSHFNIKNPNKVRALIGSFAAGNPVCFHDKSGRGYRFLAGQILSLDSMNPSIAARLMGRLSRWKRYDTSRQVLMKEQIERILSFENTSKGVYEIASKSLEN